MAFAFIPMTIGALAGVRHADAGIASGLINTTQQVGGSIGVALATTVAATYTSRYLGGHAGVGSGAALVHGFQIAFWVLAAIAAAAAVLSALIVESKPAVEAEEGDLPEVVLEPAA
jgi:sugar phosphate permease